MPEKPQFNPEDYVPALTELREQYGESLLERSLRAEAQARAAEDENSLLKEESIQDAITGGLNRKGVEQVLGTMINQQRRETYPEKREERIERSGKIGLVIIDLKDFKPINDALGHDRGDSLLAEVAESIERSLRPGDCVGRIGGDEYAILLNNTSDPAEAMAALERIEASLPASPLTGEPIQLNAQKQVIEIVDARTARSPQAALKVAWDKVRKQSSPGS